MASRRDVAGPMSRTPTATDARKAAAISHKEPLPAPPRPVSPPPPRPTSPPPPRPTSPPPPRPTSPPSVQPLPSPSQKQASVQNSSASSASRAGQLDKVTVKQINVTEGMVEEMMTYFASDECNLLLEVQETDPQVLQRLFRQAEQDSKILIEAAGSVVAALQLCRELNKTNRKFSSVADVAKSLPIQDKSCIDCRLYGGLCPRHLQKIKEQSPQKLKDQPKVTNIDIKEEKSGEPKFLQEEAFLTLEDREKLNVKLLGEYLTSKKCLMLSQCPQISTSDLLTMLKGRSLRDTLNFCKFLDFRCQQYDDISDLVQTLQEVRETAPVVKKVLKEVINTAAVYRLPGWGQRATSADVDFIFQEADAGLACLSHVREMLQGTTRYNSKQELSRAAHAIHEAMVERRRLDLENMRLWFRGERGEPCKVWNSEGKRHLNHISIIDMRDLFRIENSSSGTVALLRCLQLEGKQFSNFAELLKHAQDYADENQQAILKFFVEKREEIFRPLNGELFDIALADIILLCEEGRAGPATLDYLPTLAEGMKYTCFEEIYGVIKKLHAPNRNPLRIL